MCDLILLYIEKLQNGTAMRTVQEFCSIRLNENSRTVEIVVFQYFFRSSLENSKYRNQSGSGLYRIKQNDYMHYKLLNNDRGLI